jgi:hypothetical protein
LKLGVVHLESAVQVYIRTNIFKPELPQYQRAVTVPLPEATADTRVLAGWALGCFGASIVQATSVTKTCRGMHEWKNVPSSHLTCCGALFAQRNEPKLKILFEDV